jgi:glycosyltransferase involved in cell wall biosynthesis
MEYLGTDKPINNIIPLVSVCVSTYQHEKYIAQCLDSILMQKTNFPFEVIIGEDESDDGTREICRNYAEDHQDRIRLFLRSRKDVISICGIPTGRYNTLETMKSARGTFIARCEGDDYWTDPRKLQKQIDFFADSPTIVMAGHKARIISDQEYKDYGLLPADDQNTYLNPKTVVIRGGGYFATNSVMFSKKLIDPIPQWFYEFPVLDEALNLIAIENGTIGFINEVMSIYRRQALNSWSARREQSPVLKICLNRIYVSFYLKFFIIKKNALYLYRVPNRIYMMMRAVAQLAYHKLKRSHSRTREDTA